MKRARQCLSFARHARFADLRRTAHIVYGGSKSCARSEYYSPDDHAVLLPDGSQRPTRCANLRARSLQAFPLRYELCSVQRNISSIGIWATPINLTILSEALAVTEMWLLTLQPAFGQKAAAGRMDYIVSAHTESQRAAAE